jgi:hypothetical protein
MGIGGVEEFLVEAFDAALDVAEPQRIRRSTVKAASAKAVTGKRWPTAAH